MSAPPLDFSHWSRREWIFRLAAAVGMTVFLSATYFGAQKFDLRPVHWLTPTALDRAIPADARAIYLYVTFYPFLWIAGLLPDAATFRRYIVALVVTATLSSLIFILYPTGVARGDIDLAHAPALYRLIESTDLPRNALPSEHASFSIIASIVCWRTLRERPVVLAAAFLWIALILWSTLATRQHVLADLLAGAVLGTLVWRASAFLKPPPQDNPVGNQREPPETRENQTDRAVPINTD